MTVGPDPVDGAEPPDIDDLDDLQETSVWDFSRIDRALLTSPTVVRAALGVIIALLLLSWPDRTDTVLARLVGLALVVAGASSIWIALRARPRSTVRLVTGVATLGVGLVLVVSPTGGTLLGRLIGATIMLSGARDVLFAYRNDRSTRSWYIARGGFAIVGGGLLVLFPDELLTIVASMLALGWILLSLLVIIISLDATTPTTVGYGDVMLVLRDWLEARAQTPDERRFLFDKILFDGPDSRRRIVRFVVLMSFSSIIAATGVITDSVAVVIGAMLIAPLMTPLMAVAVSMVMGWPTRLARSTGVALLGIGIAIGIGMLLGEVLPAVIDTSTNTQIVSRTSPTTLDLVIALAAGAAGAYGLSRPDVSDSLPGVAIAISLVPPLSVAGIAYSQGDAESGTGALLLFATNMLAIIIMGGITFIITGVTPLRRVAENQSRVRTAAATTGTLALLVFAALMINGNEIASDGFRQSTIEDAIRNELDDNPQHRLDDATIDGDTVTVTIIGPAADAPTATEFLEVLADGLGRDVDVDLRLVIEEREFASRG